MKHRQETLVLEPPGRGLFEITRELHAVIDRSGVRSGLCQVFLKHTSASLVIQENADPSAARDLERWFERAAPDGDPVYEHVAEGPDDMPAHIRAALTSTSEIIPVVEGRLGLGTWQGLFLFEHRLSPGRRQAVVTVWGT
jgi:secondary thiamine-phosphate synthase enzyme